MEGANENKSNQEEKATEKTTAKADLPTCDSTCEVFLEPQETFENTTVDQPADDSQSIIRDIQIENERLRKKIHQVTTLKKIIFGSGEIDTSNQRTRGKTYSR